MPWLTIAVTAAGLVGDAVGAKIIDIISFADLQYALNDAVNEIQNNTQRAILEDNIRKISADIETLTRLLSENNINPNDPSRLNDANTCAISLVSNCKTLSLVAPSGPGLAGHPFFLIAVNLNIAVLQEKAKLFPVEKQNIINLLINSLAHASRMETGWFPWNEARFSNLYCIRMIPYYPWFIHWGYLFEGNEQIITTKSKTIPNFSKMFTNANTKRLNHISREEKRLEDGFVLPSMEVGKLWASYLKALVDERVSGGMQEVYSLVGSYRRNLYQVQGQPQAP
jgi:hypothetical protein